MVAKGKSEDGQAEMKELPLQLLKNITNDYAEERKLYDSPFGTVYKGILEDGELVDVKKVQENSPLPTDKTSLAALIKHENTVQLVGFSHETTKKLVQFDKRYISADITEALLCYEHMPKGTLQRNLFDVHTKMDWETRFKIIKGICNGLLFLHSISVVHMDLKPENILLDNNMRPKIADFTLSRIFGPEATRLSTQNVVGSYGYMAPEYLYRGEISTMSDIYSLGLLIIEITTGEQNPREKDQPSARNFTDNVRKTWTSEHIASLYSSSPPWHLHEVEACIKIGLNCTTIDRRHRPSIEEIVHTLNSLLQTGSSRLLSLQPRRIDFPMDPKRLISSSLYLVNSTDDHIAFRLSTELPRRYLRKLPFYSVVPPKCTYTLTLITREQKKPPPSNSDECLMLQSRTAHHENLDNADPASVAMFLNANGDEVQETKVAVACGPLAETIPDQIIDGQTYHGVLSIDVHPTEPWILTSNQRGYVSIWNYQIQAEEGSIEVTREPVHSAKFIGREEWFVVGSGDGYIYVYDYNTMEEVVDMIEAHDGHRIMCLAVNPTHSFVLSASDDHTIKLWDWTNEWQCTRTFEGHYDTVTRVMFDPRNSESFSSASLDHTVKIWNIHSGTCNITWDGHPHGLLCVHYFPRYFQQFLISGSSDGAAKIWDLEKDTCVDTLQQHAKGLSALCWHKELRVLVTGSLDGTVRIWNWNSTSSTYRLENIIGFNLGAVNALGYLNGSTRIVVGCDQGIALMEVTC